MVRFITLQQFMNQQEEITKFIRGQDYMTSFFLNMNYEEERKIHTPFINIQNPELDPSHIQISCVSKKGRPKGVTTKPRSKKEKDGELTEKNMNLKSGHWCLDENKKYHWFLQLYSSHFMQKHMRRMDKIFKTMAKFISSRQAEQCRSHHQKMEKKYHTFSQILMSLRRQHYGTHDPLFLEQDIINHGYTITSPILSKQTLMLPNHQTTTEQNEQKKDDNFLFFKQQQKFQQNPIDNLFNDQKYETNLNLFGFF